jgi:hypothetical protein
MTGAANLLLDELRQWRNGQRRFDPASKSVQAVRPYDPSAPFEPSQARSAHRARFSISFSDQNYDMIYLLAKRLNLSMASTINVLLDELNQ